MLVTTEVVTVKVAELPPAATVTLAGTVAITVLLLERVATIPPVGAGPVSVTVPVEALPPVTLVGLRPTELNAGGFMVSVACEVTPAYEAEMTTV
jgi:hypothetical protein